MLEIAVESSGNTGGKYFPCSGYFGVTPVVVSGKVTTRVPPLAQPLPVKAVYAVVRYVESRGSTERILWEKVKPIWSAPEYTVLGEWSHPFRVSISPEAAKIATSSLNLKEWRGVWKFDIAIEHEPIPFVGHRITKSFHLNLRNYTTPRPIELPPLEAQLGTGPLLTNVKLTTPSGAFGPEDSIEVAIQATPQDSSVTARKATLVLERVLDFLEEGRTEVAVIASSSANMTNQDDIYRCCLAVKLPKRTARWDVGETSKTLLMSMKFQLRAKVVVKGKGSCELSTTPMAVQICGASAAQRSLAISTAPVKQRKHRSARRGLYMQEGTVEISDGILEEPVLPSYYTPPHHDMKPILLPPDHPVQAQSISFVFPSPPPHASYLAPIPSLASQPAGPPDGSWSIHKRFQHTGRRISTTASEEEALQPSRSKQKVSDLPSLDSLGLGLPPIARRPVTAPAQFSEAKGQAQHPFADTPRPLTSGGAEYSETVLSPRTFAFTVEDD